MVENLIVIALGGNALLQRGQKGTFEEQYQNVRSTVSKIADLIQRGHKVVMVHGNGPQVGATLLRHEAAKNIVPSFPLDACGAETQGFIGYMIQQALRNELKSRGIDKFVVTIITRVIVDKHDSAFQHPTKPIGPFYSRTDAEEKRRTLGWQIVEDAARGYRRVVPSPEPLEIVELDLIRDLVEAGALIVCTGGGGIPVLREEGTLRGVEAVIDKDRASAVLASQLSVDLFAISTDTDFVYVNYKKPNQSPILRATASELEAHHREGHFPPGNMGPKVESVLNFLCHGGKEAIITSFEHLAEAVKGSAGTHIVPDPISLSSYEEVEVLTCR